MNEKYKDLDLNNELNNFIDHLNSGETIDIKHYVIKIINDMFNELRESKVFNDEEQFNLGLCVIKSMRNASDCFRLLISQRLDSLERNMP